MATINSTNIANFGNQKIIFGTIEVTTSAEAFVLAKDNSPITWCLLTNQDSTSGLRCLINSSDGSADTAAGSIYCDNSSGTVTAQYVAALEA
jgi:hypothetical protein